MFTYCDAQAFRPSLVQMFEEYWARLPEYQKLPGGVKGLDFKRLLFAFFPTYKASPLEPGFDRWVRPPDCPAEGRSTGRAKALP
jgi:lycopene cyclase CruP